MDDARSRREVSAREWLLLMAAGALVFFVAHEAGQHPIAMAAASFGMFAMFGLLWRLLAVPLGPRRHVRG